MQTVDLAAAQKLLADLPPQVIATIVTAFEADVIRLVQEMASASAANDQKNFRMAAHALAGVAGNLGARRLEELAEYSENVPHNEAIGTIRAAAQTTISELKQLSGTLTAGHSDRT
jgi:HPt (histidine-containing phosphotransfer) domain-containing protein